MCWRGLIWRVMVIWMDNRIDRVVREMSVKIGSNVVHAPLNLREWMWNARSNDEGWLYIQGAVLWFLDRVNELAREDLKRYYDNLDDPELLKVYKERLGVYAVVARLVCEAFSDEV